MTHAGSNPAALRPSRPSRLPALSVRQPWAWLIVNGHKPVENRTWPTGYRGPLLIHAPKTATEEDYFGAEDIIREHGLGIALPHPLNLQTGGIVGRVDLVGCVDRMDSPWYFGPWGFVLDNATPVPFWACPGRLGLFVPGWVESAEEPRR